MPRQEVPELGRDVRAVRERRRDAEAVVEAAEQADVGGEARGPERGRIELEPGARLRSGRQRVRPQARGARVATSRQSCRNSALAPTPNSSAGSGDAVARLLGGLRRHRLDRLGAPPWRRPPPPPPPDESSSSDAAAPAFFFFGLEPRTSSSLRLVARRRCSRTTPLPASSSPPGGVIGGCRPCRRNRELARALALLRLRQRHPRDGRGPAFATRPASASSVRPADASLPSDASATATPGRRTVLSFRHCQHGDSCSRCMAIPAKFRGASPTAQK